MQTISIVLIAAAILLLFLLAIAPCQTDHYADQVVHAGVGNIAGPIVQIDERPYIPPQKEWYGDIINDEDDMITGIVGKVA